MMILLAVLVVAAVLGQGASVIVPRVVCQPGIGDIYQFSAKPLDGSEEISFEKYRGQVVLIVNVGTYGDKTTESYQALNALAEFYDGSGLVILGFPCNDFGKNEPGATPTEILNAITYVRPGNGFVPRMTLFQKISVNGDKENTLYTFLKDSCTLTDTKFRAKGDLYYDPLMVGDIHWNFEKILVDRKGKPYTRYHPDNIDPENIKEDINYLLNFFP